MDEPTSGLDPVVRDDILDALLEFVQDEQHAVLISSHITSDLEKVADSIVFLHEGRVRFHKPIDELRDGYGLLQCGETQFQALNKKRHPRLAQAGLRLAGAGARPRGRCAKVQRRRRRPGVHRRYPADVCEGGETP